MFATLRFIPPTDDPMEAHDPPSRDPEEPSAPSGAPDPSHPPVDAPPPAASRRHRSKSSRSKNTRRLLQAEKAVRSLKISLIIVLLASVTTILLGKTAIDHAREQNTRLTEDISALEEKIQGSETDLKRALEQMNALVEERLPGIMPLAFEQVLPLDQQYAKNIVLTQFRSAKETRYEYRLVLFNQDITPVLPRVTLYLFDRTGIQTGMSDVVRDGTSTEGRIRALAPGEIRSFNGSIVPIAGREPAYFLLALR